MLKIKSNVDLKELEKFGFVLSRDKTVYEYGNEYECITIFFFPNQKVKTLYCDMTEDSVKDTDSHLEVLYDLIQAGLVEKVEE